MGKSVRDLLSQLLASPGESLTVDEVVEMANSNGHPTLSRAEVVEEMKRLESNGLGRFIAGRRGHVSRFVVRPDGVATPGVVPRDPPIESGGVQGSNSAAHSGVEEYNFPLRPGFTVSLRLPNSITPSEADRLSKFIQLLVVAPDEK